MKLKDYTEKLNLAFSDLALKNLLKNEVKKQNPHAELFLSEKNNCYLELKKKIKVTRDIYISKVLIPFDENFDCKKTEDEHFELSRNFNFNKMFIILSLKQTRFELIDVSKFLFKEITSSTTQSVKEFVCVPVKLFGDEEVDGLFNERNLKQIINSKIDVINEKTSDKFESFLYWFNNFLREPGISEVVINDLLFYNCPDVTNVISNGVFNKDTLDVLTKDKEYREYVRNVYNNCVVK